MHHMSGIDGDRRVCNRWSRQAGTRRVLMGATALTVLSIAAPVLAQETPPAALVAQETPSPAAVAQETPPAAVVAQEAPPAEVQSQDIVVTASRAARTGFSAPTPTT